MRRRQSKILTLSITILILLTSNLAIQVDSQVSSADNIFVIDDTRKLAFFGWWKATEIHDAKIWELFGRTVDWALGGDAHLPHQDARILLFTFSGDLDPTNEAERDCIAFYDYLTGNGFQAKNLEIHIQSDAQTLPSTHYENFDLVLHTSRVSYGVTEIVNSGVPFITVCSQQTHAMGLIKYTQARYEGYGDTFVVAGVYYPTQHTYEGEFLICESAMSYDCVRAIHPDCSCLVKAWQSETPERYDPPSRDGFMYALVSSSIYPHIEDHVFRYAEDVQSDLGIEVRVVSVSTSLSPADVKTMLQEAGDNLQGCLFIGNIAPAWYKYTAWNKTYEFPTDWFYMDLDGNWTDSDNDGKYDTYTWRRLDFEIWVARLDGSLSEIQNYFDRNHAYRTGSLLYPERALVYKNVHWGTLTNEVMITQIYPNITVIVDPATICRDDYLERIAEGWSIVHVYAHGNNYGHTLASYEDYESINPPVLFYNLFSCSGARFTDSPCVGLSMIHSNGLALAGQTTTGIGMVADTYFYILLSQGRTLGEAFREGYNEAFDMGRGTYFLGTSSSYLGMVLLGDPTIIFKEYEYMRDIAVTSLETHRNIWPNATQTVIEVTIRNLGEVTETFNVTVFCNEIEIGVQLKTLPSNQSETIAFSWITPDNLGNYTLRVEASKVPDETNIENNIFFFDITISIPGDINADGIVNILDIANVAKAYGKNPEDPEWNGNADVNEDGIINILDIAMVAKAYGKEPGDPEWNGNLDVNEDRVINILDIATVAKDYGKTA